MSSEKRFVTQHTGANYETIAEKYAATVDTKRWNAHYERPAMLSLIPPSAGTTVLDVGCGSGWYAGHLAGRVAVVTCFDYNEHFVALTRARLGNRAKVLKADLAQPLTFAESAEVDLAVCPLVLHYLHDWLPPLREIHRVFKPEGALIFSTHYPFNDWKLFDREDYFATELLEVEWEDVGKITFCRRPLTAICEALHAAGFWIEKLLEPQPTEDFRRANPTAYERLKKNPWFPVVRARSRNYGTILRAR